jgi:protoporphyrinogen oxidase
VPTSEIRAEWAAQRIKGLSFFSAAKAAFFGNKGNEIKTLIGEFNYPRYGPGQMWETMTDDIRRLGGEVLMETPVERIVFEGRRARKLIAGGVEHEADNIISSLPLRNVVGMADPSPGPEVLEAARGLRYRDFLTVSLVLDGEDLFPDNWIYIHEPDVESAASRTSAPGALDGPGPDQGLRRPRVLLLRGDELWEMDDDELVELGMRELGAARPGERRQARVRLRHAGPEGLPDVRRDYAERVAAIRAGSTASRTCSRSAATGCTATTTPITRC